MDVRNDFNGTTGNLGRDVKSLEEGGLSGFHTSVTSGDVDVVGGDSSSLGGSGNLVLDDNVTNVLEVGRGEDESDVTTDVGKESLEVGVVGEDETNSTTNEGVLSHEDLSLSTKSLTDLMHLVGSDIVNVDDEDRGCSRQEKKSVTCEFYPIDILFQVDICLSYHFLC